MCLAASCSKGYETNYNRVGFATVQFLDNIPFIFPAQNSLFLKYLTPLPQNTNAKNTKFTLYYFDTFFTYPSNFKF